MRNILHTSNICYLKDFSKKHDLYKKRLNAIKPVLKINPPYKVKNNIKGYSFDKYKIKNDNKILNKKTKEISNRKGEYNQNILRPRSAYSGFRNSNYENYLKLKRKNVDEDNIKIFKRINSTKPVYSYEKMRKDALEHEKCREFMLEVLRKNRATPLFNDEMENILNL